jgi:sugar phosphate isomerase/epimerase
MKLAYSTYATQKIDVYEALSRIRSIGYDAVEIAVADPWSTAPAKLDTEDRSSLRAHIVDLGFPSPVLFGPVATCARGDDRPNALSRFTDNCRLANALNFDDAPAVVTSTLSGPLSDWESDRERIVIDLCELANIGAEHNTILAIEPHVGGVFDSPDRGAWVIEQANHPHLRLNYDQSHFHVQGMALQHCVDLCLPHAAHIHVKGGYMKDGKVQFLLPGEGDLDLAEYLRSLHSAGCHLPVTAEVSAMIWNLPDYDPWTTAEACYRSLDSARKTISN